MLPTSPEDEVSLLSALFFFFGGSLVTMGGAIGSPLADMPVIFLSIENFGGFSPGLRAL